MEENKNEETLSLSLSLKKCGHDSKNCNLLFSNSSPDSASTLTLNSNAREPIFMDMDTPSSISETSTIKPEPTSSPNETIDNVANTGTPNIKEMGSLLDAMVDEWTDKLDPGLGEGHAPEPGQTKIKDEEKKDAQKIKEEPVDNMVNNTGMAALTPQVEVKDHLLRNDMANMVMTKFDTLMKESDKSDN